VIEAVIAEDYHFSSPMDNLLDRAAYFRICWPNCDATTGIRFIQGAENGDFAWIDYEARNATKRFRNAELHRLRAGTR
jgi:hypothetical protein